MSSEIAVLGFDARAASRYNTQRRAGYGAQRVTYTDTPQGGATMLPKDTAALAKLRARFDAKWTEDPETGCHVWSPPAGANGYGQFWNGSRVVPAHRHAWEAERGAITGELRVCHTCDNPLCVRVAHMFLGTAAENAADMVRKGRSRPGDEHSRARLTAAQVAEIRAVYAAAAGARGTQAALSRKYGVRNATIWRVVNGVNWKIEQRLAAEAQHRGDAGQGAEGGR